MMIKIGKFLILFLITISMATFNQILSIDIKLADIKGNEKKSVKALEPFMLIIEDTKNYNFDHIDIEGLENFTIIGNRKISDFKNTHNSYYFTLKAARPGKYQVKITDPRTNEVVNLEIAVKDPIVKFDIILEAKDFSDIFAGQKVNMILRFLYKEDKEWEFAHEIITPKIENLIISVSNNLKIYKKSINNKVYQVIEIYGFICPEKSGEFVIQDFFGVFLKRGVFSLFFQTVQKEYFPNKAINVTVKDLPGRAKHINVVGKFTKFDLDVEKKTLNKEEPILLTASITGEANFDLIKDIKLKMPNGVNLFDPKVNLVKENNQETKKFEYVIQPLKSGTLKIPSQVFHYFDPEDKLIKKLITKPINLEILETLENDYLNDKVNLKKDNLSNNNNNNNDNNNDNNGDNNDIKYLIEKNSRVIYIPWTMFFIMLLFPIGFVLALRRSLLADFYNKKIKYKLFNSFVLKKAIKDIDKAKKEQKSSLLYSIVKDSFVTYILKQDFKYGNKKISDQEIIDILNKNNVDSVIINKYKALSEELLSYTKYNFIKTEFDNVEVFERAKEFIVFIKGNKKLNKLEFKDIAYCFLSGLLLLSCFNLSNAENKLEELAMLYKAQKYACTYDRFKINKIINSFIHLDNDIEKSLKGGAYYKLYNVINVIPLLIWQIMFLILWVMLIFSLLDLKKYLLVKAIIFTVLLISCCSIYLIAYEQSGLIALVKTQEGKLYLGPGENYPVKQDLKKFDMVKILKTQDFGDAIWYYISAKMLRGWVKAKDLKLIV